MVTAIRRVSQALGDGIKKPSKSEAKNISVARKSIVATGQIRAGEVFSEANIAVKRPGNGINPMRWDEVIGQVAQRGYDEDDLI
jgi:N,N'-diacetyllegionaminate synthase